MLILSPRRLKKNTYISSRQDKIMWVSDCCLTPNKQFSAISWREQVTLWWEYADGVCFALVLDHHYEFGFNFVSSLKQQSVRRHVASLVHILILSQPVFVLTPKWCVLSGVARDINFIVFSLIGPRSNTWSTALVVSTLTIAPLMRPQDKDDLILLIYTYCN